MKQSFRGETYPKTLAHIGARGHYGGHSHGFTSQKTSFTVLLRPLRTAGWYAHGPQHEADRTSGGDEIGRAMGRGGSEAHHRSAGASGIVGYSRADPRGS